jgi:hypothetical protein
MHIINATWEERNTGFKSCEVVFEKGDSFQDYVEAGIESIYDFSVVKIPIGNLEIVHAIEEKGYRYLENQLVLSFNVNQVDHIEKIWFRLFNGFSYKHLTIRSEISHVLKQVNDRMFESDRFSQDPFWAKGISSKRYVNWIEQLFEMDGVKFYSMIKNGEEVGFFSIKKESQKINSCPIAGIYNQYKSAGYIFVLVWYILIISREMGARKFVTSISSNNRNLLSSFSKIFNFKVDDIFIVLRKIIS